ncbi:MAG: glycosyl transferase family 90 [Myxococcota bacterium]
MVKNRLVFICALLTLLSAGCGDYESISNYDLPYENQIDRDLKPFQSQRITIQQVREAYQSHPDTRVHIKIYGSSVKARSLSPAKDRIHVVVQLVRQAINRFGPLGRIEFVYNLLDEPQISVNGPLFPIFSFSASPEYADIVFPMIAGGEFLRMDSVLSDIKSQSVPFNEKKDRLVWRGSQTGGVYEEANWRDFPRSRLVLFSSEKPDLCDAGFTSYTQVSKRAKEQIENTVGLKRPMSLANMQAYRYIASLDGNVWPDRFPQLLATNSLIFKERSRFYSFFDLALGENVHYLSLDSDMSNLESQILWAKANPDKVVEIIGNANFFARDYLKQSAVEAYVYKLLLGYSAVVHWD